MNNNLLLKFACSIVLIAALDTVFAQEWMEMSFDKGFGLDQGLQISGICDVDHKCPDKYACRYLSIIPGTQACVYKGKTVTTAPAKRPGTRCPTYRSYAAAYCNDHEDCPSNKRCCPLSFGDSSVCVDSQVLKTVPTITPVIVGSQNILLDNNLRTDYYEFMSSVTLVQSNGYNVLVDTSSQRAGVLQNLYQTAGLIVQDIDMVIETHGHADHYSNAQTFENADHVYNTYAYTWHYYKPNPLQSNQQFFLNNDRNLEIIQTPGHTPQDVSLIVRNVPGYGTVSVVGDLISAKNDGYDRFAFNRTLSDINRNKVACMSNWIVPGHGQMFQIDAEQRAIFKC
jgi:glyoxylase-like metal-dependent hydrolase (beta-lactamase superfamily II)